MASSSRTKLILALAAQNQIEKKESNLSLVCNTLTECCDKNQLVEIGDSSEYQGKYSHCRGLCPR